jgi:hypothetical protein
LRDCGCKAQPQRLQDRSAFAGTPETAKKLFNDMMQKIPKGSKLYIDVPELTGRLSGTPVKQYGKSIRNSRMYSLETPK